ncbi:uncharacterized protein LOC121877593 isoform X2 [Homarus americanus]|uniref:Uncharacterized protein n=1 Tax=Homarus americanus TaxID=6706 RepID=A0A8J5JJ06_HOMAM|nr:uncharacterized protein LOC121877593 isoform X2 [Homarus americanus]KAG7159347.1 hypothetical protein Hamer_G021090 [Homarus americanus]
MSQHRLEVNYLGEPVPHARLMPRLSIAGSIGGLSTTSRLSRVSHATTIRSVATLTETLHTKTGLSIPILPNAFITNVQRGSLIAATYSIIQGLFAIVTGVFDIYALSLAAPGSSHYGFYLFSYDFVYSGSPHVRYSLMLFGGVTAFGGLCMILTSVMLLQGLRKEMEMRLEPWIWCMAIFTIWRSLIIIYASIVNDLVFSYHILMCLFWIIFILGNVYAWLVVHSFYHELCEVTRLEDVARVKMETMSSFTASRPTTPGARSDASAKMIG